MTKPADTPPADGRPDTAEPLEMGILSRRVGIRIRLVNTALEHKAMAGLAKYKLRPGGFTCMALISANPGCSQVAIARDGGLEKTALVATVDDLEEKGYAIRKRFEGDRRRNALYLTDAGEALLAEMVGIPSNGERAIKDTLSDAEIATLCGLLDRLYSAVR